MNVGKIALALWVVTVGAFAFYFVRGHTSISTDQRRAIQLSVEEKDFVLAEMRSLLSSVNGILRGLHEHDMIAVAEAAKSAGMGMAVDASPLLMVKLPLEFKIMGMGLHEDFDKLSVDIKTGLNRDQVIHRLSELTSKCVSCHQIYRLSSDRTD
ncbi:hypothetical protein [Nitrosomonas sp. Nm33]|uniref:hypothetical protein n=1 Tax=Nitrosomonas sp. Nm33 TaxID=133724 RepID=UPI00089D5F9D|nr:hypothetical protein [Nitrosomonas sp. Nm33]SDY98156.1 hypothetical protein SAMN05421755_10765 [Nitrosomonas sp. Nm33]